MNTLMLEMEAVFGSNTGEEGIYSTSFFPGHSQICSMICNILGYDYQDYKEREEIEKNFKIYSLIPENINFKIIRDFQVSDLSINNSKIITKKTIYEPKKKNIEKNKVITEKFYLSGILKSFVIVDISSSKIDRRNLDNCMNYPRRPPYWGRKCCIFSNKIYKGIFKESVLEIIDTLDKNLSYHFSFPYENLEKIKFNNFEMKFLNFIRRKDKRDVYVDTFGMESKYVRGILIPKVSDQISLGE